MKRIPLSLVCLIGISLPLGCSFDRNGRLMSSSNNTGIEEQRSKQAEQAKPAPRPIISSDTHLAAGRMLEKQGDLLASISQYERAIAAEPRLVEAYNRLGIVYQKLGRYTDADYIFQAGLRSDAGSATLHNNLGYSYLLQQRFAEAEPRFREALTISPDFERARMNLAVTLGHLGRMEECGAEFARVVPPDIAHYNVAMLELHRGNYEAARRSLNEALAVNPACPGAAEHLRRVEALAAGSPAKDSTPVIEMPGTLAGTPTGETVVGP